jgi:folate-binding protein YgfZ
VSNSSEILPRSPFAALTGAVGSPPEHYGNPLREQKLLAQGEAIVDLSNRAVITITGPDRLTWLDSLTSQALAGMQPGDSAETLQLDPTGHLEFALRIVDDGEAAWILVDADQASPLETWLNRMRFTLRVEIANRSAGFATIGTLGEPALPLAMSNGVPLIWRDPWKALVPGGFQYATAPEHPAKEWTYSERLVARSDLAEVSTGAGAGAGAGVGTAVAGTLALEALRVAAWRPRFATEVDTKSLPHELDWLRSAVHLSKGCYRGQETVAKVHNLGHPPRRLVLLHLDGSEGVLPIAGDGVRLGEKVVGQITTAARHYELGPIALAVVKRSVDPAAELTVVTGTAAGDDQGDDHVDDPAGTEVGVGAVRDSGNVGIRIAATQEVIVPTDAGAAVDVPRLPRLGAVTR